MSGEKENIIPTMTGGATPTTQASVPVMGVPSTTDSGTVPNRPRPTCSTHREARGTMTGCCTNKYGATEEAAGWMWVTEHTRECSDHRLLEEEDYEVDARVEVLERGQREIKRDLKEVILAIPDVVIRALRAE
ncbi:UNVERIFIED_CONTAM: hypothetical protein K2H54_043544 [Gekko kuhli]